MQSKVFPQLISVASINNDLFFNSYVTPGTFVLREGKSHLECIKEKGRPYDWRPYCISGCVSCMEKIVFVPYKNMSYIPILDTTKNKFTYIHNYKSRCYKIALSFGEFVYLFGEALDGNYILKLNCMSLEAEEIEYKGDKIEQMIQFGNYYYDGKKVYFPNFGHNGLGIYDFVNNCAKKITLPTKEFAVATLTYDGDLFWLTGHNNDIVIWDEKSNDILECIKIKEVKNSKPWEMRFSSSMVWGDYIYFSPVYHNKMIRVRRSDKTIEELFEIGDKEVCWNICKISDKEIYVDVMNYYDMTSRNYVIDVEGNIKKDDVRFSIEEMYFPENMHETKNNNISKFLNYVLADE